MRLQKSIFLAITEKPTCTENKSVARVMRQVCLVFDFFLFVFYLTIKLSSILVSRKLN